MHWMSGIQAVGQLDDFDFSIGAAACGKKKMNNQESE
jgi:hypothetical protein